MMPPVEAGRHVQVLACESEKPPVAAGELASPSDETGGAVSCVAGTCQPSVMRGDGFTNPSKEGDSVQGRQFSFWCSDEVLEFEQKCDFFKLFQLGTLSRSSFPLL